MPVPVPDVSDMNMEEFLDLLEFNRSHPIIKDLFNNTSKNFTLIMDEERVFGRGLSLLVAYGILATIALFGNILVCHVIFNRKRMRTVTNIFIANLAVSDILLIVLNVPFNIAKDLTKEWPFGNVMCHIMNMSLITSVYASTFTLTVIALDRQRVLLYPLRPRILKSGGLIVVAVIWLISILLALPFGIFSETKVLNVYVDSILRCRSVYPSDVFEQYLTVVTIMLQYVIPLSIIAVTYGRIVRRIWERTDLGAVTENQHARRSRHKKKSIKMLMIVVIVFAICWMPLNLYHLLTDLHPDAETFQYNNTAFFICHWVALSSTCYNPFIYCWLNEAFRAEMRAIFKCCPIKGLGHTPNASNMAESLSHSDMASFQVKPRNTLYRRGNAHSITVNTLSGNTASPTESISVIKNMDVDKEPSNGYACENICVTPDSWKSIGAISSEEAESLLDKPQTNNKTVIDC